MLKSPELNKSQIEKLSDIFSSVGVVTFASAVLPAFLSDKTELRRVILGIVISLIFWLISLSIREEIK